MGDDGADKSLLIGVFKHGYEKYNAIRSDPKLVFLAGCGPPDEKALMAEENDENIDNGDPDELENGKPNKKRAKTATKDSVDPDEDIDSMDSNSTPKAVDSTDGATAASNEATKSGFPTLSDLNARLRRLIASYQRENRKEAARKAQRDKRQMDRRERFE